MLFTGPINTMHSPVCKGGYIPCSKSHVALSVPISDKWPPPSHVAVCHTQGSGYPTFSHMTYDGGRQANDVTLLGRMEWLPNMWISLSCLWRRGKERPPQFTYGCLICHSTGGNQNVFNKSHDDGSQFAYYVACAVSLFYVRSRQRGVKPTPSHDGWQLIIGQFYTFKFVFWKILVEFDVKGVQ